MDLNNLKSWCDQYNIIERTMGYFWTAFENYQNEEPIEFSSVFESFDKKNLSISIREICMSVDWPDFSQMKISVYLYIHYCDKYVGYYKAIYETNGEAFDDFFVIEGINSVKA